MAADPVTAPGDSKDESETSWRSEMTRKMDVIMKAITGGTMGEEAAKKQKREKMKGELEERTTEKRLERLEREAEEEKRDEEETDDLEVALREKKFVRARVDKWYMERGFGLVQVCGRTAFVHAKTVRGGDEALKVGSYVIVKLLRDLSRREGSLRSSEAWRPAALAEQRLVEDARKKVEVLTKTSYLAARVAERTKEAVEKVLELPPGLARENSMLTEPLLGMLTAPLPQEGERRPGRKEGEETREEERRGKAAEGGFPTACAPKNTTTTTETETQTELKRLRAPWPETLTNIDVKEIEKLLDEQTAKIATGGGRSNGEFVGEVQAANKADVGSKFAKTMKAKWLMENFSV